MLKRAGKIAAIDIDPQDVKPSDALNEIKFVTERMAPIELQSNVTNNVLIISKDPEDGE